MATKLRAQYQGRGRLFAAGPADLAACEKLEEGRYYTIEVTSPRSLSQNNLMWAMARYTLANQRAGLDIKFEDAEQLRAWALVHAGHSHNSPMPPNSISERACRALRSQFIYAYWDTKSVPGTVILKTPRETKEMEVDKFSELIDRLAAVMVQLVPGLTPEELIEEAKASVKHHREAA
jgi:hypothetical protein